MPRKVVQSTEPQLARRRVHDARCVRVVGNGRRNAPFKVSTDAEVADTCGRRAPRPMREPGFQLTEKRAERTQRRPWTGVVKSEHLHPRVLDGMIQSAEVLRVQATNRNEMAEFKAREVTHFPAGVHRAEDNVVVATR